MNTESRVTVPPSRLMTIEVLRMHIQKRHKPRMSFWDRRAHDQDHQLRKAQLDHVHEEDR